MILTGNDMLLMHLLHDGTASIFTTADKYPDKQKYWMLVSFIPLIDFTTMERPYDVLPLGNIVTNTTNK